MFPDPQVVTVNAVAKSMPRISSVGQKSTFAIADQTFTLTISHSVSKDRIRSMVRIDQRAIVPDPLTSVNDWETLSFYFVVDRPQVGFSVLEVEHLVVGLQGWLNSTRIHQLYGQES